MGWLIYAIGFIGFFISVILYLSSFIPISFVWIFVAIIWLGVFINYSNR